MLQVDGWITFTSQNVLAVRRGDKTNTMRVMKVQPLGKVTSAKLWADGLWRIEHEPVKASVVGGQFTGLRLRCPYGKPGDILGVREGYQISATPRSGYIWGEYLADHARIDAKLTDAEWKKWTARKFPYRATPSRFMYGSLVRDRLLVKSVRVERVQDISKKDAIAEGITWSEAFPEGYVAPGCTRGFGAAEDAFFWLWDSINAKRGFAARVNPWAWSVGFERIET